MLSYNSLIACRTCYLNVVFLSQVNGVDTVRVPMSVVPFVEPSQRLLMKKQGKQEQSDSE